MAGRYRQSQYHHIVETLKNLPEEDRIILGLYFYEGLTADQIDVILNHKNKTSSAIQHGKKSIFRHISKPF